MHAVFSFTQIETVSKPDPISRYGPPWYHLLFITRLDLKYEMNEQS